MLKKTIRLDGKKHRIPICFEKLLYNLESLVGLENVGIGEFRAKNYMGANGIEIKYYDKNTLKMKITASKTMFNQDFYLRVNPSEREYIEEQLRGYRI